MIQDPNLVLGLALLIMLYFFWRGIKLFRGKEIERSLERLGKNIDALHPINKKVGQSYVLQGFGIFIMALSIILDIQTAMAIPSANVATESSRPILLVGFAVFIAGMLWRGLSINNAYKLPDAKGKKKRKSKKKRK